MLELFKKNLEILDLPDEAKNVLICAAEEICLDRNLLDTAKYYKKKLACREKNYDWNVLFKGKSAQFGAFVYICAIEDMEEEYERLGIDRQIMLDTADDLAVWIKRNKNWNGEWGFTQYGWLPRHLRAKLFRLGRIQFERYKAEAMAIYKNCSGEFAALPVNGWFVSPEGYYYWENFEGVCEEAVISEDETYITSNYIFENSIAVKKSVALAKSEWTPVVLPGDPVLNVHIPRGAALTKAAVLDSFEQAKKFFTGYDFKAFCCFTWLFDPAFANLLPEGSNILDFQSLFIRYVNASADFGGLDYVFVNKGKDDMASVPRDTTFRKTLAEFIEGGGVMHSGGGYSVF